MKENLKISLSFNHACKLNDNQKIKLITCQARKLSIENWEIEALLKLCKSNGWVDKGLALLYEYAGYMDELRILVNERSEIIEEVVLYLLDTEISESIEIILLKIQYVSELTAKIIMKLSRWRLLQWIPRPLYFTEIRGSDKVSIQFLLKEEASILFQAIKNKKRISHNFSDFTKEYGFDDPLLDNSSLQELYITSREILLVEVRIDTSWKAVNTVYNMHGSDTSLSTLYPTLRLPYSKKICHPPTEDLAWFENLIDKYKMLCSNMTTVLSSFSNDNILENKELKSKVSSRRRIAIVNKIEDNKVELSNTIDIVTHEIDEQDYTAIKSNNNTIKSRRNQAVYLEVPPIKNNNNESENNSPLSETADLRKRSVTIATVGHIPDPSLCPNLETNRRVTHAGEMHATIAPNSLLKFRENSSLLLETTEEDMLYHQNDEENCDDDLINTVETNIIDVGEDSLRIDIETFDLVRTQNDIDLDATYLTENVINSTEEILRSRTSSVEYIFQDSDDVHKEIVSEYIDSPISMNSVTRNRSLSSPAISMNFLQSSSSHSMKVNTVSKNRKSSPFSQKLIRAANRLPIYQDEDGNSLELETLQSIGILDNLSRPYSRTGNRREFGMMSSVLSKLTINDDTISQFAVRKIIIWWRLLAPQKKLLRRMQALNICKDILRNIVDASVIVGITRQRRRIKLLRYGACMTIQRYFRRYYSLVLIKDKLTKQKLRRDKAWDFLNIWRHTIFNGIRIYKYIQYNKNKKIIKAKSKEKGIQLFRRILKYYMNVCVFNNKILHEKYDTEKNSSKQLVLYREKQLAAIIIQKYFRRYSVIIAMLKRSVMNVMISKITFFFIKCVARHRVRKNLLRKKAALRLQRFFRGVLVRQHILKIVSSGLKLKTLWKKHKAYINLKAQLRRVDRPYTLIMHGIRNIQKKSVSSHQMRFKVSAWWHPLLHIVNRNDVDVIINTKQPQLIYSSICYEFQNSTGSSRRLSIVQGIRKISNIFIPKANERNIIALPSIPSHADISSLQRKASTTPSSDTFAVSKPKLTLPPIKSRANSASSMLSVDFRPSTIMRQSALMKDSNFDDDEDDDDDDDDDDEADQDNGARDSFVTNAASRRSFLLKRMLSHANDLKSSTTIANNQHRASSIRKHSIATITMMASSRNIIKDTPLSAIYKTKAKTFLSRFSGIAQSQPELQHDENKLICNFEDNAIKIPGCHGNSVIKFDIFDGERLFGYHIFYMNKEGEMMYWGGEYSKKIILQKEQRRVVQGKTRKDSESFSDDPILDFRINAGAPLRAKCSWGRLAVRGNGPLKRLLKARRFFSSFIFDKWHRFYFSLDEIGLSLFDNKFNTTTAHIILVKDFKEISVDIGAPIRESSSDSAKNIVEDIHNVKLITYSGDEIYMRFPDASTRIGWQDVLCNAISYYSFNKEFHQAKTNLNCQNSPWRYLNTIQESSNYIKNSGMLATSVKIEEKSNNSSGKYFSIFSKSGKIENKSINEDESSNKHINIPSKSAVRLSLVENRRVINSTTSGRKIN